MVKRTKKIAALMLSAVMVMGSATTVLATEGGSANPSTGGAASAPIYSYDISNVVVPTDLKVAFNPDGHTVTTSGTNTTTDQIVSLNYGIVNKSSKDKLVAVEFEVTDLNTTDDGESVITFASSEDEVTNAEENSYVVYLEVIPGTVTTTIDHDTVATTLANVEMTKDTTKKVVIPGSGNIGFALQSGKYEGDLSLDGNKNNNVADSFDLTGVNTGSYMGFTFGGSMNTNTNWSGLTAGIKIDVTYSWETTETTTYGVAELPEAPSVATTVDYDRTTDLVIPVSLGAGDLAATGVAEVAMATTATSTFVTKAECTYADGSITMLKGMFSAASVGESRFMKVTFNDDDATTIIVELKIVK